MLTPPPPPPSSEPTTHLLEINLISAQSLKPPSAALRRLQPYAVAYINPSTQLRTRVDRCGGHNPTWNDKFLFRISSAFLSAATSAVHVDIYSVGVLKDHLLGSVHFLLSNVISSKNDDFIGAPTFAAAQIRRPSGRFHGVLNLGVMIVDGLGFERLDNVEAIGYRDLMGENHHNHRRRRRSKHRRGVSGDSVDYSDETESSTASASTSSSSSTTAAATVAGSVLKEKNGEGTMLCGLGFQKKKMMMIPPIKEIHALGLSDVENC